MRKLKLHDKVTHDGDYSRNDIGLSSKCRFIYEGKDTRD